MNIILEPDEKSGKILLEKNITHIKEVLKKGPGETIKIGFINGPISLVKIIDDNFHFQILERTTAKKSNIRLLVALSRPQTMKKIIEHGTTMGVCEFIFYHAHLSEKSYETSKVLEPQEYQDLMSLGLAQAGIYTQLPTLKVIKKIHEIPTFKGEKFLLSLRENNKLPSLISNTDTITLAIGPERGFIPSEEELFIEKGFKPVKISESILRVEHAAFSSIAQLDFLRMS